ncbi:ensconsin-like [Thalassophryne amazonica]|uniref:ensconsin-like n=1 Tax=Thalassophryne amazonica TaxID=390379 RepID=UPI0014723996|nr:ensconsin-like [Thalassophryne amazonica]
MPGSVPIMAVQKKQSSIPPSPGPFAAWTAENQRKGNGLGKLRENCTYMKGNSQVKKMTSSVNSAQICKTESPRAAAGSNVDERLKLARGRREEHQRLLASRELSRLEREQRAKRYYEQQLQDRKKKLMEQRLKEERRRAAVEEKRKQRQREETERYESAVRKTIEKSQKVQQNVSQNSRGRKISKSGVPRHLPLTPWEKKLVSRLLTPTCSYLARSKSAGCHSGAEAVHVCRRAVSFHSMNTITPPKPQQQSVSAQRRTSGIVGSRSSHQRGVNLVQVKPSRLQDTGKCSDTGSPAVNPSVKPATIIHNKTAACSPDRKSVNRHPAPAQLELPSVPEEDFAICGFAFYPGNSRPVRTSAVGHPKNMRDETPCSNLSHTEAQASVVAEGCAHSPPQPPGIMFRCSDETTDPQEALHLLAEKKQEACVQREREDQDHLQRQKVERRNHEELERRRAEERAQQQAEAQRLIQEKRRREEEEQKRAEEERAQAMREAALLQKQREEEQAKERAKEEQVRQEREMRVQKEEAERQARKKRLEEIMRRTRRTESPDTNSVPEDTKLVQNVNMPVGLKPSQLEMNVDEDMVPVVAFKERRSLRTLASLDKIQTHQRAEVI